MEFQPTRNGPLPAPSAEAGSIECSDSGVCCRNRCGRLLSQLRSECIKLVRFDLDYGLQNQDWRILYGGTTMKSFGPIQVLFLRCTLLVLHLVLVALFTDALDMLNFTTWSNIAVIVFLLNCSLVSCFSVASLALQYDSERTHSFEDASPRGCRALRIASIMYYELLERQASSTCSSSKDVEMKNEAAAHPAKLGPQGRNFLVMRPPFGHFEKQRLLQTFLMWLDGVSVVVLPAALATCIIYWIAIFPNELSEWSAWDMFKSTYQHTMCLALPALVMLFSRLIYRLCLLPFVITWGLAYLGMTLIIAFVPLTNRMGDVGYVYWFFNFSSYPLGASVLIVSLVLFGVPFLSLLCWLPLWKRSVGADLSLNSPRVGAKGTTKE